MTFPPAEEPTRPDAAEPNESPASDQQAEVGAVAGTGAASLSEKPVLEWTTDDWARWIEAPPPLTRPAVEPEPLHPSFTVDEPSSVDGAGAGGDSPIDHVEVTSAEAPPEDRLDGEPTGAWSIVLDEEEEDDDAEWWSSVAGLPNVGAAPPPAPAPEVAPSPAPPLQPPAQPAPPAPTPPPPPPAEPAPVPPVPPAPTPAPPPGAPLLVSPPLPPLTPPGVLAPPAPVPGPAVTTAPPPRQAPSGHRKDAPRAAEPLQQPRSPNARSSFQPEHEDMAVRVRAGLSLLGVSVLVGAVAAGLITVAIFLAAVVLRRALG